MHKFCIGMHLAHKSQAQAYASRRDTHLSLSLCICRYIHRTKPIQSGCSSFVWGLADLKSFSERLNNITRKPLLRVLFDKYVRFNPMCALQHRRHCVNFSKSKVRIARTWDTPLHAQIGLDVWVRMCTTSVLNLFKSKVGPSTRHDCPLMHNVSLWNEQWKGQSVWLACPSE